MDKETRDLIILCTAAGILTLLYALGYDSWITWFCISFDMLLLGYLLNRFGQKPERRSIYGIPITTT